MRVEDDVKVCGSRGDSVASKVAEAGNRTPKLWRMSGGIAAPCPTLLPSEQGQERGEGREDGGAVVGDRTRRSRCGCWGKEEEIWTL